MSEPDDNWSVSPRSESPAPLSDSSTDDLISRFDASREAREPVACQWENCNQSFVQLEALSTHLKEGAIILHSSFRLG